MYCKALCSPCARCIQQRCDAQGRGQQHYHPASTSVPALTDQHTLAYLRPDKDTCETFLPRCDADGNVKVVESSYYHSTLNVSVPAWEINTTWTTTDLHRFDNVLMSIWVLFQVRSWMAACSIGSEDRV